MKFKDLLELMKAKKTGKVSSRWKKADLVEAYIACGAGLDAEDAGATVGPAAAAEPEVAEPIEHDGVDVTFSLFKDASILAGPGEADEEDAVA